MKKFLSLVLALVMTMSLVTISAGAKDFTDDSKVNYDEAVDVISALDIVGGYPDGSFNPAGTLTRGAAAKIICNLLLGVDVASTLTANTAPYKDVPVSNTFAGYIAYCKQAGVINGYADGTFRPAATLTGYQFLKMLLGALGYKGSIEGFTGGNWTINVAKLALQSKLIDGIEDFNGNKALAREEACQLAFNTLKSQTVTYPGGSNTIINIGDVEIKQTGTATKGTTVNSLFYKTNFSKLTINNNSANISVDANYNITWTEHTTDGVGRSAHTWYYKGKAIGTYAAKADQTFVVDSVSGTKASLDTWLKDINKDYTIPALHDSDGAPSTNNCVVYVNGTQYNNTTTDYAPKVGDVVDVFQNSTTSTTIDRIVITNYKLAKITKVDTNVSTADKNATPAVSAYVTLKDAAGTQIAVLKDTQIEGFDASTYVKNAYIAAAFKADKTVAESYVVTAASTGKVSAYKADQTKYTIDGTEYKAVTTGCFVEDYTEGDFKGTYAAYTDKNGLLIGIVEVEAAAVASDAVYVVDLWSKAGSADSVYNDNTKTHYAQVVDMDGKLSTLVLGYTTAAGKIVGMSTDNTHVYSYTEAGTIGNGEYYVATDGSIKLATGNAASLSDEVADIGYTRTTAISGAENKLYSVTADETNKISKLTPFVSDSTYDVDTVSGLGTTTELKADATKVGNYYVNADTKYIVVEGTGSTAKTVVKTGGLGYKGTDATATILYVTSGSAKVGAYVILPVTTYAAGATSDLLYKKSANGIVDGGYAYTMYKMDGTTIDIVASNSSLSDSVFYKYTVDSKGVYTLGNTSALAVTELNPSDEDIWSATNTNHAGVGEQVTFVSVYNDKITLDDVTSSNYKLNDIKADDVVVIDLHETDNDEYIDDRSNNTDRETYSAVVDSLDALDGAKAAGYTIVVDTCVTKDGAQILFVTEVYRNTIDTITSGTATVTGFTLASPTVTVTGGSTNTIVVSGTGSNGPLAEGDTIVITLVPGTGATTDATSNQVTLTYSGSAWGTASVVVTAENGSVRTYAVSATVTAAS